MTEQNQIGGIASDALKQAISRIENLEEEKKALTTDIADIYAQAKSSGFDAKIIRQVIKLRKLSQAERDEAEQLLDIYLSALGEK